MEYFKNHFNKYFTKFLQALLGEQGLTVCWFCVCISFCVCVWDDFLASDWSKVSDVARRRKASYDIARLLLMVPIEPWQNSTPFFGAAAFCTTKIGDFRTSSTLSSLMTWLRRPLRKYQLRGTATAFCTTKIDDFRASSTLSSLTTWLRRPLRKDQLGGTFKMHCTSLSTSVLFLWLRVVMEAPNTHILWKLWQGREEPACQRKWGSLTFFFLSF